jgi:hypothetical protein
MWTSPKLLFVSSPSKPGTQQQTTRKIIFIYPSAKGGYNQIYHYDFLGQSQMIIAQQVDVTKIFEVEMKPTKSLLSGCRQLSNRQGN